MPVMKVFLFGYSVFCFLNRKTFLYIYISNVCNIYILENLRIFLPNEKMTL